MGACSVETCEALTVLGQVHDLAPRRVIRGSRDIAGWQTFTAIHPSLDSSGCAAVGRKDRGGLRLAAGGAALPGPMQLPETS
jgi:hypothetical protein